MLTFITTIWITGMLVSTVVGFYTGDQLKNMNGLTRVNPLKTAGYQSYGLIPRLEPGLRILNKFSYDTNLNIPFETFSLEILKDLPLTHKIAIPQMRKPVIPKIPLNLLFQRVREIVASISTRFMLYIKKLYTYTSVITSLFSPLNLRTVAKAAVAGVAVGGMVTSSPTPVKAGLLKYQQLSPIQRVATTPLYYICNSRGNAYLQEDVQGGNPDQRTIVYFMSHKDAENYLNEMTQANNNHASEFRVMAVSMEKVLNNIQSKKQSRKMGRYDMDLIYRIQPSTEQFIHAEKIAGKSAISEYSIPMFAAEGLAVKRVNGEMVTPYYFSYEDLVNDWEQLTQNSNQKLPTMPKVVVKDFTDVMMLADGNTFVNFDEKSENKVSNGLTVAQIKEALLTPGVVPAREEIEKLKSYYRHQNDVKGEFSKAKLFASP